jgi:hypothetical protein
MANQIVTVNVSQTVAPTPSTLQKTGAFISQGATSLASGTYQLLTQLADLTSILNGALAVTSIAQTGGLATVTTAAPHGIPAGDSVEVTISGASPAAYNGTFLATYVSPTTFTYAVPSGTSSPATGTIKWTLEDVAELLAMGTTFFGQGSGQGVYVLELGTGTAAEGVTALSTFIQASPQFFYSYLVPRNWAAESTYLAFVATFENPTAKTYFFTTMTTSNYTSFTAQMKSVIGMVEAPGIPAIEFSLASLFYWTLHYNPSATNKVTPTAFTFLFGVTPYPTTGNSVLLAALKAAGVNVVGIGSEGGISNALVFWGTTMDGRDFTYWYSVDWVQINIELNIANAVINGSNNPINPLYYNQDGINRLQAVAAATMASGVSFGLVLGNIVQTALDGNTLDQEIDDGTFAAQTIVNAIPFIPYSLANPGDFKIGKYAGFAIVYTPNRGFTQIIFNVNVTDFVAA